MPSRKRRIYSIQKELLEKSKEAALSAIQIYNNPQINFKAELFIVTMIIAWTYLLHAYYRREGIEYRYFRLSGSRRKFDRTKYKAYKFWELERCLNDHGCPLDKSTSDNLKFLILIRHEIEHQMTLKIDDFISAKFQACALNYNYHLKSLFGDQENISENLSFSIQFSGVSMDQIEVTSKFEDLPKNIQTCINQFEDELQPEEYNDPRYSYRLFFVPKIVNNKNKADQVIEFIRPGSETAKDMNTAYAVVKETERQKYFVREIIRLMHDEGYPKFNTYHHTQLWKEKDAKNPAKGYGVDLKSFWFWYDTWIPIVREHCQRNRDKYL